LSVKRKSKSQPARKTAVKSAGKRKSALPKASSAKTVAKKSAAGKPAARKGNAARVAKSGSATKRAKTKNIFAKAKKTTQSKAKKTTKSKAKSKSSAAKTGQNPIAQNAPLIEALDRALSGHMPESATRPAEQHGHGGPNFPGNADGNQGRPAAWRPSLSESDPEPAEAPVRTNKLVPTNAVHTTKRRLKRNTWQSPVLGLGAVAAVLAVLVLGNNNEPPDVSPLERRVEAQPNTPVQKSAEAAHGQNNANMARPAMPPSRGKATAREPDSPRGLKVLELVEMERMLARLEMDPSQPDGVVDLQTKTAIRTYQQIAGLPVDGEATPELLDDMREVVGMMDGTN